MLTKLKRYRWYLTGRWKIKKAISKARTHGKVKIIIGAGPTKYPQWISTDLPHFDALKEEDWVFFFNGFQVDNFLAEHVIEHFTEKDATRLFSLCHRFLRKGGKLRIAVPDGCFPNPEYIEYVRPGGSGSGAHDHKMLWDVQSLTAALEKLNFKVTPLEYWNSEGKLIQIPFEDADGSITRSAAKKFSSGTIHNYSSLIVDAVKVSE